MILTDILKMFDNRNSCITMRRFECGSLSVVTVVAGLRNLRECVRQSEGSLTDRRCADQVKTTSLFFQLRNDRSE